MDLVDSEPYDFEKQLQEQMSHKVIEKRRRDRINACLSELSQTVPAAFSKQSTGKLEKAEILEMTVDYLKAIQTTEVGIRVENGDWYSPAIWTDFMHHYQVGYNDCIQEIFRYMADQEGFRINDDRWIRMKTYLETKFKPDASVSGGQAYTQHTCVNKCKNLSQGGFGNQDNMTSDHFRFHPYVSSQRTKYQSVRPDQSLELSKYVTQKSSLALHPFYQISSYASNLGVEIVPQKTGSSFRHDK